MTSPTARARARLRRHLLISTPSYDGQVATDYVCALLGTFELLGSHGIQRARDKLAAEFLSNPDATHLLFVDADIVCDPRDVLRMIEHDKDVCCGAYRAKSEDIRFNCCPLTGADGAVVVCPRTGCIEVDLSATGFMLIWREVFLKMIEAYPQSRIKIMANVEPHILAWIHDFFPCFCGRKRHSSLRGLQILPAVAGAWRTNLGAIRISSWPTSGGGPTAAACGP